MNPAMRWTNEFVVEEGQSSQPAHNECEGRRCEGISMAPFLRGALGKEAPLAIRTEKLTKVYHGREALQSCNLEVRTGSIYGLLGANGAGKTTLLKILTGLIRPTDGQAEVLGLKLSTHRNELLGQIGSMIETPVFYEHLSGEENLRIHLAYMGMEPVGMESLLERVGLHPVSGQPVAEYSLGMRQRLAIARALSHRPALLLLDEPVNGLDPMGIREMRMLFLSLVKEDSMTIVMSSHILSEIELIADTVGILSGGRLVGEADVECLRQQESGGLESFFLECSMKMASEKQRVQP